MIFTVRYSGIKKFTMSQKFQLSNKLLKYENQTCKDKPL